MGYAEEEALSERLGGLVGGLQRRGRLHTSHNRPLASPGGRQLPHSVRNCAATPMLAGTGGALLRVQTGEAGVSTPAVLC